MLGPDSRLLTGLLIIASAALLVGVVRVRLLPLRVVCGALSIVVAMTGGVAAINFYYGYYTSWSQLWADVHGTNGGLGTVVATRTTASGITAGRLGWTDLPGKLSGYDRRGLVYLPPQYAQPRYAQVRFPVVELFHGTPGNPLAWASVVKVSQVMDVLIARHEIGPMVLVMPSINGSGHDYQDCVNGPAVNDETYLMKDVRADVLAHYRVSADPYEWGASGYSSGGYCAANLALRHRTSFGAAAVIEGYFRAADGPAADALNRSQLLENANSPLYLAERFNPAAGPVPAFWVAGGLNDPSDYRPATVFTAAMSRFEQVPFVKLNAGDTGNAWSAAMPAALTWMWQQLAPPDLRVQFPVRTVVSRPVTALMVPPVKHRPRPCGPAQRPGTTAGRSCLAAPHGGAAKPALRA
jgi:poly(3-hydroxybutyrate) depolymerase